MAPLAKLDATYHLRWSDDLYEELSRQVLENFIKYGRYGPQGGDRGTTLPEPEPNPLAPSSGGRHAGLGPGGGRSPQANTPLQRKGTPALDGPNPSHSSRPDPAKGDGEGDGAEILPSRPERRAQTVPHLTPTRALVVHEVQASLPPGRPLMMSGGRGRGARGIR
jgi:hypothetical protein